MKRISNILFLLCIAGAESLWSMTGISTSITMAEKYYGVNQSVNHYWNQYLSNNIGYSLSRSEGFPWMLNSASTGMSATLSEMVSISGNFSQSVPSDGYSYTNGSGSLYFSSADGGNFSPSWSFIYSRTVHRQEYTNRAYDKSSVLSYAQNSFNTSFRLTIFFQTSVSLDFTTYWYDTPPSSYANSIYVLFLNSLDRNFEGDQRIFTMQGISSSATHSSYGTSLSHQVFSFMRLSTNLNANRAWLRGNWTGSQSISCTFSIGDWSITPSVSRSNFLVPDGTGAEAIRFNTSYTLSIYRSFR